MKGENKEPKVDEVQPAPVEPIPPKPTRPWLPELLRHRTIEDFEERNKDMARLLDGRKFKVPDNWMSMKIERKAEYLDKEYPLEVKA